MQTFSNQQIVIDAFLVNFATPNLYYATIPPLVAASNYTPQQTNIQVGTNNPDVAPYTSVLGTPVWDRLIIQGDTYTDSTFGTITYPDIYLDTVLMNITQQNNVIMTPIQGRDGEVVEYTSKMSCRINFKGGIFGTGLQRPTAQINDLANMLNSNKPLIIKESRFLVGEGWNIYQMFVLDKNIPQAMGGYNYQLFEFNCIQDLPVILASQQTQ